MGGFKAPILHGLCSFGFAGKAVYDRYVSLFSHPMAQTLTASRFGAFKNIKVRFAGPVIPGQTLVTEMWRDGSKVTFQSKVKETGKLAIAGAAAELVTDDKSKM